MRELDTVTDATFEARVFNAGKPVLVDFTASWCGPCKAMVPALLDLADEYRDEVDIVALDVDSNPEIVTRYNVRGFPTFILFKGDQPVEELTGGTSRSRLANAIEKHLEQA